MLHLRTPPAPAAQILGSTEKNSREAKARLSAVFHSDFKNDSNFYRYNFIFNFYFFQRLSYCWVCLRADGHGPFIGSAVTGPVNDANPTGDSESTSLTFSVYCNCCGK